MHDLRDVRRSTTRWFAVWLALILLLLLLSVGYFALVGLVPIVVDQRGDTLEIRNLGPGVRRATFEVHAGDAAYTLSLERIARGVTRVPLADIAPHLAGAQVSGTVIRGRRLGVPYEWVATLRVSEEVSTNAAPHDP